ncbi:Crp/Fnr family transcriptional regulator [Tropicimonas sp. IMCC6043]|uniref:Crp/Fnr family transcriptional regulator n=1 Tax=Tropicimonas sp. IMCC6043 TaxID=2510645 RepID=UPI001F5C29EF|nr:cyclic nucleotide-binding domain-containing protein [Tropicimonas sp. IMCC6043]
MDLIGWAASAATLATYSMKTMLPLRIAAIISNLFFIAYSLLLSLWPMLFLDLILLPFNLWRTAQILRLRRRVAATRSVDSLDFSVLKSYSRPRRMPAGTDIFCRGDTPDALYFIDSGEIRLEELDITLGAGEIFGEIAFFTDAKARTATARCTVDSQVHVVDEATFLRLYFQDPAFGMAIMKTITRRLVQSVERRPDMFQHSFAGPGAAAVATGTR